MMTIAASSLIRRSAINPNAAEAVKQLSLVSANARIFHPQQLPACEGY